MVAAMASGTNSSPPHSYLVLKEGNGRYRRGELVKAEVQSHRYQHHTHYLIPLNWRGSIPDSNLAPLTEEACIILDSISNYDSRYAVYSTPGKLEWGVGLKVGDTVLAQLPGRSGHGPLNGRQEEYSIAIIRWIGPISSGRHSFGVEIKVSNHLRCPALKNQ
jgi:hypothetical protein